MKSALSVATGLLLVLVLAACPGQCGPEPAATADEPAAPTHWTYEGEEGPDHWGELSSDYALCGTGLNQSPIDIANATPGERDDLVFHYYASPLTILNNGHTVQVNYNPGSTAAIDGTTFNLVQLHVHTPSEHTLNGTSFAGELHAVHRDPAGNLAVVGLFIQEGAENRAFHAVIANAPKDMADAALISGASVDMRALLPQVTTTYRYTGSLTTPPCSEDVSWNLMSTPIDMSAQQISALHAIVHDNNRPVREVNSRVVIEDSPD